MLVVLPGGRVLKPVLIETIDPARTLEVRVSPILEESVTVSGSAPGIEATPASGTTMLSHRELELRQPATLVQALENVAGVSMVSEGQSAVPAVRGMARGRTLILVDGARVTSERRVGPSATFLDPFVLEDVEVARGPGSVAYGSDAFGGVILARTRSVAAGSPLQFRFSGSAGAGVPQGRAGVELAKGLTGGGVLVQAHYRASEDYRSPEGEVFNSGASDQGFGARVEHTLGRGLFSAGFQSDFARDVERPRNNSSVVRFYYPTEDSHRFTTTYDLRDVGPFSRAVLSGFLGTNAVVTDQDRFPTATQPRQIERADVSANDFHVRGSGSDRWAARSSRRGLTSTAGSTCTRWMSGSRTTPRVRSRPRPRTSRWTPPVAWTSAGYLRGRDRDRAHSARERRHPGRSRDLVEHGRILRGSIDGQRRRFGFRGADRRAVSRLVADGTGGTGVP